MRIRVRVRVREKVCVCVCERERERESECVRERDESERARVPGTPASSGEAERMEFFLLCDSYCCLLWGRSFRPSSRNSCLNGGSRLSLSLSPSLPFPLPLPKPHEHRAPHILLCREQASGSFREQASGKSCQLRVIKASSRLSTFEQTRHR